MNAAGSGLSYVTQSHSHAFVRGHCRDARAVERLRLPQPRPHDRALDPGLLLAGARELGAQVPLLPQQRASEVGQLHQVSKADRDSGLDAVAVLARVPLQELSWPTATTSLARHAELCSRVAG
jgi:hypothetical protein